MIRVKVCVSLLTFATAWAPEAVHAQEQIPHLHGSNAVVLPYIEVPFVSSTFRINQGTRSGQECGFPINLEMTKRESDEAYKKVEVQREVDYERCQEILEIGLVPR